MQNTVYIRQSVYNQGYFKNYFCTNKVQILLLIFFFFFLGIESFQCNPKGKRATYLLFALHFVTDVSISIRLGLSTLIKQLCC